MLQATECDYLSLAGGTSMARWTDVLRVISAGFLLFTSGCLPAPPTSAEPDGGEPAAERTARQTLGSSVAHQQQKLVASDFAAQQRMGEEVEIDGITAAIAAPKDDHSGLTDAGGVYIFVERNGTWTETQKLTLSNAAPSDRFGADIALEGDTLLVTAPGDDPGGVANAGAVHVYKRNASGNWSRSSKLTASNAATDDALGISVAIDGNWAAVCAAGTDHGRRDTGSVYVFQRTNGTWTQHQEFAPSGLRHNDGFGLDIAIDDRTILVGAPFKDSLKSSDSGVAYVYRRGGSWQLQQQLVGSDTARMDRFGIGVALEGDEAIIGAQMDYHHGYVRAGSAYVFTRTTATWTEQQKLIAPDAQKYAMFGRAIDMQGDTAVIGAPHGGPGQFKSGATYVFVQTNGTWSATTDFTGSLIRWDIFGGAVALEQTTIVTGAPGDTPNRQNNAGSAFIHRLLPDADGDGVADVNDGCPNDTAKIGPGVCGCGNPEVDADGDGVPSCKEACDQDPNKTDPGICGCGKSDGDMDGDGVRDCRESCPADGQKTEPGVCGCGSPDIDGDGDGTLDCKDGCDADPGKIAPGACGCGAPDTDSDSDGTADCQDTCPDDPARTQPGACGCGAPDSDGDGRADCDDACPQDADKTAAGLCGCGIPDTDSDGDGRLDCDDSCPNDGQKIAAGACGCGAPDTDSDSDATADCNDACPDDPAKTRPGICGCGSSEEDTDGDGAVACEDACPDNPNKTEAGICGCGSIDVDTDSDGTADCHDACPTQPGKTDPGVCGCRTPDTDSDGDGTPDCDDFCPEDPAQSAPGGCDVDGDGTDDEEDNCPAVGNAEQVDRDGDGTGDACEESDDRPTDCADCSDTPSPDAGPGTSPERRSHAPGCGCSHAGTFGQGSLGSLLLFALVGILLRSSRRFPCR